MLLLEKGEGKLTLPDHRSRILEDRRDGKLGYHHEGRLYGRQKVKKWQFSIELIGKIGNNKIHIKVT